MMPENEMFCAARQTMNSYFSMMIRTGKISRDDLESEAAATQRALLLILDLEFGENDR